MATTVRMLFVLSPVVEQEETDLLGARARKSEQQFSYSGSEELKQTTSWGPGESMDERTAVAVKTVSHSTPKIGRNEPCPCGSGKKYKKCCGG